MLKDKGSNPSHKPITNMVWVRAQKMRARIWNFLCLAPLSAIFQLYRGDQFGGGGSRREPQTLGKQLVNFITCGSQLSAPIFWARTHAILVIGLCDGLLPLSFNIV
jgi:hypothetical protein